MKVAPEFSEAYGGHCYEVKADGKVLLVKVPAGMLGDRSSRWHAAICFEQYLDDWNAPLRPVDETDLELVVGGDKYEVYRYRR